ncbi:hypothetical protein AXG93_1913s1240 [Marchantia polymorpha subsp. ruderalis]|uniref:Secreted protein n=1 Tax=Marchantia polymorpha subsp. ruderalis TaxID=1480154 RepID=A0A176WL38_MARPO|nr:hypothetical protein AXG93_1913s1240 [Marchantia polymorpha subsp. ruderalis]
MTVALLLQWLSAVSVVELLLSWRGPPISHPVDQTPWTAEAVPTVGENSLLDGESHTIDQNRPDSPLPDDICRAEQSSLIGLKTPMSRKIVCTSE